jgi:glycosyltransferase involved in cell wall biosynthesis
MPSPTIDIIVPVWNNPFETRACLAALLNYSPEARLIVIDNGSNRETERMLEEFSERLGEHSLFITPPRNIGLVPALNLGLARSESDLSVIVKPHVTICSGWLEPLLDCAAEAHTGIVTPLFRGDGVPRLLSPARGCSRSETFSISFAALLLRGEMHRSVGGFDEELDGGEWCLRDYIRRAGVAGYHTVVSGRPELACGQEQVFGSTERRRQQSSASEARYFSRWGLARHYAVYFGRDTDAADLDGTMDRILSATRRGHRFSLFLHHKQQRYFQKHGWNALHTGVELCPLALIWPERDLIRQYARLKTESPDVIPVRGREEIIFPGLGSAILFSDVAASLKSEGSNTQPTHSAEAS